MTLTGPWMHAGSFSSLGSVLRHYRNPGQSLLNYDGSELPAFFVPLVDSDVTRNQARIASVSGIIGPGIPLNDAEIADLTAFLESLTDPAAATPVPVPTTVPSGLPVD